jgi:hypothetical protein
MCECTCTHVCGGGFTCALSALLLGICVQAQRNEIYNSAGNGEIAEERLPKEGGVYL